MAPIQNLLRATTQWRIARDDEVSMHAARLRNFGITPGPKIMVHDDGARVVTGINLIIGQPCEGTLVNSIVWDDASMTSERQHELAAAGVVVATPVNALWGVVDSERGGGIAAGVRHMNNVAGILLDLSGHPFGAFMRTVTDWGDRTVHTPIVQAAQIPMAIIHSIFRDRQGNCDCETCMPFGENWCWLA